MGVSFMLLLLPVILARGNSLSGSFTTPEGSDCTWFDLRVSHSDGAIGVVCTCTDQTGRPQNYGCQYSGELYSCRHYQDNKNHVLNNIVKNLSAHGGACDPSHLTVPLCNGLTLDKEMLQSTTTPCTSRAQKDEI